MIKDNLNRFTRVALSATFCLLTMVMVIPTKALTCKDVNVIFLRGSSQNYPVSENVDPNFPGWSILNNEVVFSDPRTDQQKIDRVPAFVTTEKESLKYFKSIGDRVHIDYPKLTMQFVSLHDIQGKYNSNGYRAVSAFGSAKTAFISKNAVDAKWGDFEIVGDVTGDIYNQSINDGAEELTGYLQDQMVSCPSQLNIVGGFSQGAQVVGEAMQRMHNRGQDNLLSRLGHVDLYGDPKFNGFELTTSRLNPLEKHVALPWARGSATTNHVGSLGPRKPYVPDILTSKTTSWCDFNDLVCGSYAGLGVNYDAHGEKYNASGGWIEQSANEIYIDIKTRLGLLAGLTDKSANSPLAFWDGIKKPEKLDVMFVMDRTGDENISLMPDPDYIGYNLARLAEEGYTSSLVGVVTYTEFSRFDGTKDVIESVVKTPTVFTNDIYGDYAYFKDSWGRAHFQNPPSGGEDLRDSPYSALSTALDQPWRKDARKVIILFSNTWGKDKEDTTNLTMKQITARAKTKNIEILPIFTSKTFRADESKVNFVPEANAFWSQLAKSSRGHATEVTGSIEDWLVYDVVMGHVYAPDIEITIGATYNKPATTTTKKTPASTTVKNTKTVVEKAKKVVLSAAKTTSAQNKIVSYAWDLNGDGIADTTSNLPDIVFEYDNPYEGEVCVTVTDSLGKTSTDCQDIKVVEGGSNEITHEEPIVLLSPIVTAERSGGNLQLTWTPTEGDMVITDIDGAVIVTANAMSGSILLKGVPSSAFGLYTQLRQGIDASTPLLTSVEALQVIEADNTNTDNSGTIPGTTNPDNTDTNQPISEVLGASDVSPQDIFVDEQDDPLVVKTVAVSETESDSDSGYVEDDGFINVPDIDIEELESSVIGLGAKLRILFSVLWPLIWPDLSILLLLLLLLLVILYIVWRDHKNKKYIYSERYTMPNKSLYQASYKF